MPDAALVTVAPSRAPPLTAERAKTPAVTGKVRAALLAMVWDGLPRKAAAEHAGISEHGLYKALRSPHVKAMYLSELEVLRTSERARNIHRLVDIRDKADNMPAVQAIKMLEQLADEARGPGANVQRAPGVTVIVMSGNVAPSLHATAQVIDNAEDEQS